MTCDTDTNNLHRDMIYLASECRKLATLMENHVQSEQSWPIKNTPTEAAQPNHQFFNTWLIGNLSEALKELSIKISERPVQTGKK